MVSIHSNRIVPNWSLNLPYERAAIVELNFIKAKMLNLPKWGLKPKWFRFCHPENPKSGFIDITTIGVLIWKGRFGGGNYFDLSQQQFLRRMYKQSLLKKLDSFKISLYMGMPKSFWVAKKNYKRAEVISYQFITLIFCLFYSGRNWQKQENWETFPWGWRGGRGGLILKVNVKKCPKGIFCEDPKCS